MSGARPVRVDCYKKLTRLLTDGRVDGSIPYEAIADNTRPVQSWATHANVQPFIRSEIDGIFEGYWRDLMQSQLNHVEIVGEKLTIQGTIHPVAANFTIPYTIGRGYSSLDPRKKMADRYFASGKKTLIILFLTDHDPEGMDIPTSFAGSMIDDFGIKDIHPVKVGLNHNHVAELRLPTSIEAKKKSARYKRFREMYGEYAYEIDAAPPDLIQRWLRDAINSVIDIKAFNDQVEIEKSEQHVIAARKKATVEFLKTLRVD